MCLVIQTPMSWNWMIQSEMLPTGMSLKTLPVDALSILIPVN